MAGSQREHLHEIGCAALRPRLRRDGLRVHKHPEASEHPYLELAHAKATILLLSEPVRIRIALSICEGDLMDWAHQVSDERLTAPEGAGDAWSRRQVVQRGAAAFGGFVGLGLLTPASVFARANRAPRPIPGGLDKAFTPVPRDAFVHVLGPGIGSEMATITDFDGIVAGSETRGTARGSDGTSFDFDTDMRFMHGSYVALDGRRRIAAFGFI